MTATDSAGASASQVFVLQVLNTNLAPTGLSPSEADVDENASDLPITSLLAEDPDAVDTHTLTVDDPRFSIVNGQLWLGSGNELNFEQENQVALLITVTDASGASNEVPFIVNVNDLNEAPELQTSLQPELGLAPFDLLLPDNLFTDEDEDSLGLSATLADGSPLPSWLVFDPIAGVISVTEDAPPDAQVDVTIIADDGNGGTASTVIQLTIEPQPAAALPETPVPIVDLELPTAVMGVITEIPDIEELEVQSEPTETESTSEEGPITGIEPAIEAAKAADEVDILDIAEVLNNFEEKFIPSPVEQDLDQFWSPEGKDELREDRSQTRFSEFKSITYSIPLARLMKNTSSVLLNPMHASLATKMDLQKEELREYQISVERVTQTTVSVGTGISVGYIVWLLRSGVVLGSMLSALPAWRSIDPLPILGSLDDMDDDDQESLESMVETDESNDDRPSESAIRRVFKRR